MELIRGLTAVDDGPVRRLAYSPSETAEMLGCTRQHVANMCAAGELRVVKFGRRVLIPASAIAELLGEEVAR